MVGEGLEGPFLRLISVCSVPALTPGFQAWVWWGGGREQVVSIALARSCCVCPEMPGAWVSKAKSLHFAPAGMSLL